MNTRALLIASGIAGAVMALLSNLPLISLGNCVICMWLWGGGVLGAWLYPRFDLERAPMTAGRGAIIGVVSGVIGAILSTLLAVLFSGASVEALRAVADQIDDPEVREMVRAIGTPGTVSAMVLVINIIVYPLFGTLGGAIGGMILGRPSAPPAPPASMV